MTKSKIFMTGSAVILAIAGAFASKAAHRGVQITGFYSIGTVGKCVHSVFGCFQSGHGATCVTNVNSVNRTIYLTKTSCSTKLHTQA